jgi:hypothetical protein
MGRYDLKFILKKSAAGNGSPEKFRYRRFPVGHGANKTVDRTRMQVDHGEATKARRARILRLMGVFKGLTLGFCILFVLIGVGAFGISVYLYFAPENTVFGVVLNIPPVPALCGSLAMLVTGILMWILVRVFFRRFESILKVGDGPGPGSPVQG